MLKDRKTVTLAGMMLALTVASLVCLADGALAQVAPPAALKLIGTMEGSSLSGAVFQNAEGQQIFYPLYDKLPDGSKIIRLRNDSISLKGPDGAVYDMFISRDTRTPGSATAQHSTPAPQPVVSQQQASSSEGTEEDPAKLSRSRPAGVKRGPGSPVRKNKKFASDNEL